MATVTVAGTVLFIFPWIFGVPTTLFVLLLGFGATDYLPPMPLPETPTHGWLIPASDPTPPNVCDTYMPSIPSDSLLVLFGGSAIVLGNLEHRDKTLPPMSIITIAGCSALSIEKSPKGIMVNADIFATDGYLAVRIKKNEFHLMSNEISYSEREEADPSRIAVYDREGKELLWVRYINPRVLEVRGVFRCRKSLPIVATKDKMIRYGISVSKACNNAYEGTHLSSAFQF
jgi:hypothetical protein